MAVPCLNAATVPSAAAGPPTHTTSSSEQNMPPQRKVSSLDLLLHLARPPVHPTNPTGGTCARHVTSCAVGTKARYTVPANQTCLPTTSASIVVTTVTTAQGIGWCFIHPNKGAWQQTSWQCKPAHPAMQPLEDLTPQTLLPGLFFVSLHELAMLAHARRPTQGHLSTRQAAAAVALRQLSLLHCFIGAGNLAALQPPPRLPRCRPLPAGPALAAQQSCAAHQRCCCLQLQPQQLPLAPGCC